MVLEFLFGHSKCHFFWSENGHFCMNISATYLYLYSYWSSDEYDFESKSYFELRNHIERNLGSGQTSHNLVRHDQSQPFVSLLLPDSLLLHGSKIKNNSNHLFLFFFFVAPLKIKQRYQFPLEMYNRIFFYNQQPGGDN